VTTEYEREAVEIAALTLEDRYRAQIAELQALGGRDSRRLPCGPRWTWRIIGGATCP
jgi:hypothetical protein